ncbi:MAG: CbiQ family ECF transporter T component [Acidimicrobiales bacterium]
MRTSATTGVRLPRPLHPGAWWLWAIGLATAASRTTNPLLLLLIVAVVAHVVAARRSDAPWARGFKAYVVLALVVIAIRVVFRMLLDAQHGGTVLFTLPEIPLPEAAAGIRLGGPVSLEGVLAALYDGLRLATLLLCVGAANVLANPKRLLKAMPAALHEIGVAVTVALTVAPQLVESGQRVRRARRLRGDTGRGRHVVREIVIPVMTDALDRSLLLASAMDSRGYGRSADVPRRARAVSAALVLVGMVGVCIGTYGLLDSTAPRHLGLPMLLGGAAAGWAGMVVTGRRVVRSRYRPDPWEAPEWGVAGVGLAVAAVVVAVSAVDPGDLFPSLQPLTWPTLPLVPAAAVLLAALPAWMAPPLRLPKPVGETAPPSRTGATRTPAGAAS